MEVVSSQQRRHFCVFFKVSGASRRPYLSQRLGDDSDLCASVRIESDSHFTSVILSTERKETKAITLNSPCVILCGNFCIFTFLNKIISSVCFM